MKNIQRNKKLCLIRAVKHQDAQLAKGFKKQGFWASETLMEKIENLMETLDVQKKNELFTMLIEEKYKNLHG